MEWDILDTGVRAAEENMRLDKQLLEELGERSRPLLHLYEWASDSATYGCLTDPRDFLDLEGVQEVGLALAQRPTGGGIVFHAWDLAFSVLVPATHRFFSVNTLENYAFVNGIIKESVEQFLGGRLTLAEDDFSPLDGLCKRFCMAQPTKYDVVLRGRKVAGAAQRRTKDGFLHQGTIALALPPEGYLEKILKKGSKVQEAMQAYTFSLVNTSVGKRELEELRLQLREIIKERMRS